jgi:hypothetical protein
MITTVWCSQDHDMIAVQLSEEEIIVTDYSLEPPLVTSVDGLDLEGWRELVTFA